jgi:hypothetical protein
MPHERIFMDQATISPSCANEECNAHHLEGHMREQWMGYSLALRPVDSNGGGFGGKKEAAREWR